MDGRRNVLVYLDLIPRFNLDKDQRVNKTEVKIIIDCNTNADFYSQNVLKFVIHKDKQQISTKQAGNF